jgi:hypothetical protein
MFNLNGSANLDEYSHQCQQSLLELKESKHDSLPPTMPVAITILIGTVESGTVFFLMLAKAGILGAAITALLPIAFLSSIAYFYALMFERPEKFKEVMEQYKPQLMLEPASSTEMFPIILNQVEYEGQKTDRYISYMSCAEPHNRIQSAPMLYADYEIDYFTQRGEDLKKECLTRVEAIDDEFRRQRDLLDQTPCPLSTQCLSEVEIRQQAVKWLAREQEKLERDRDMDLKVVQERYQIARRQCESKVEMARQEFQAAEQNLSRDDRAAA